ncbi:hypothetical protein T484DRAFT_1836744 [Baffinella frigidus]|nr:hypothetical protein T484DRAFT_1836744 [Cryptophyta sp. CCMP2293]
MVVSDAVSSLKSLSDAVSTLKALITAVSDAVSKLKYVPTISLRALFTVVSDAVSKLKYVKPAVAIVLGLVGVKMIVECLGVEVGEIVSLGTIIGVLGGFEYFGVEVWELVIVEYLGVEVGEIVSLGTIIGVLGGGVALSLNEAEATVEDNTED